MENPTTQQFEADDVIMKDVGLLAENESPKVARDASFDPMHINAEHQPPSQPQPQPTPFFTLSPNEQNNFEPWLGPSAYLANPPPLPKFQVRPKQKVPLRPIAPVRPTFRFSPQGKSKPLQAQNNGTPLRLARDSELGVRQPFNYSTASKGLNTRGLMGKSLFDNYNTYKPLSSNSFDTSRPAMRGLTTFGRSVYERPYRYGKSTPSMFEKANLNQRANTSRDSSFSSFDSQKSTEDGKADSFDSLTSVSTDQSSFSRKRSVDIQAQNSSAQLSTPNGSSGLFSKHRRRSSVDELGSPVGPAAVTDDLSPFARGYYSRKRSIDNEAQPNHSQPSTETDDLSPFARGYYSRKRSIDNEAQTNHLQPSTENVSPGVSSKYRRLSADGLGIPSGNMNPSAAGLAQPVPPPSPSQRVFTTSTSTKLFTPTKSLSPNSNFMAAEVPLRNGRDTQLNAWESKSHMPGCWPTPPSVPVSPMTASSPFAKPDEDIIMDGAMMSGALVSPSVDYPHKSTLPHNPLSEGTGVMDTEQDQIEHMIPVPDAQAPVAAWHTYYASVYASLQRVFQNRIVQNMADAFKGALAYIGQNVWNHFEPRGRRGRHERPARRASPNARNSPARTILRTLSPEQQQRIRSNQWRRDRGYPIVEEYPFPQVALDTPQISTSPTVVSQPENVRYPGEQVIESATPPTAEPVVMSNTTSILEEYGHNASGQVPGPASAAATEPVMESTAKFVLEGNGHSPSEGMNAPATTAKAKAVTTKSAMRFSTTSILKKPPPEPRRVPGPMASASGVHKPKPKSNRIGPLSKYTEARLLQTRHGRGNLQRAVDEALKSGDWEKFRRTTAEMEKFPDRFLTRPVQSEQRTATVVPVDSADAKPPSKKKSVNLKSVRFREPLVTPSPGQPRQALMTELAPHLRPSPPDFEQPKKPKAAGEASVAQKENLPPTLVTTVEPADYVPINEHVETADAASSVDPWNQPADFPLGRPVSAVSLFYPVARPLPPGRTESIYADEFKELEEQKKLDEGPTRIRPQGTAVRPLSEKWETRVDEAMRLPPNRKIATTLSGDPLTKKDLETCFTPLKWLNDEVINSYLALIIDYLRRAHGNAGRHDKPRFHAFNSFFFSNLRDKGYESVRRWASRAKIGGENLLNVDTVFVPVHNNSHWTLIVVKPSDRTIENFDSLGSLSRRHIAIVKTWLRGELGEKFDEDEWTVLPSVSPQQDNGSDCGVFLLSTAKAVALDIEPMSYGAENTTLLRKKIVAELMNGGLEGDFGPVDGAGVALL
ncbi:hypothetical protein BJY00DRAFT_279093 [Aspergillus carlsbadensis]|nr:hypothetical protein BJY00DRAFT_279093 [Aspergillus carlsbadensis]